AKQLDRLCVGRAERRVVELFEQTRLQLGASLRHDRWNVRQPGEGPVTLIRTSELILRNINFRFVNGRWDGVWISGRDAFCDRTRFADRSDNARPLPARQPAEAKASCCMPRSRRSQPEKEPVLSTLSLNQPQRRGE